MELYITRFPLSRGEQETIAAMRGKLACLLADCGFAEAAAECRTGSEKSAAKGKPDVDLIVSEVMRRLASNP